MDEAYSYGYNNSRDASTITPRKQIEELVMAEDIKDLPSLHGFIKFPDGFPAARIKLSWRDYEIVAEGFQRVSEMRAADYTPSEEEAAEMGVDGREGGGPDDKPKKLIEADVERSDAELEAERLRREIEGSLGDVVEEAENEIAKNEDGRIDPDAANDADGHVDQFRFKKTGEKDYRERQKQAQRDIEERSNAKDKTTHSRDLRSRQDGQESELAKENLRGFGSEPKDRDDFGIEDDDQEIGR
jgi:hypothetical protein